MASGSQWLMYQGKKYEEGGFETTPESLWEGLDAALFLRDDLLKKRWASYLGVGLYSLP